MQQGGAGESWASTEVHFWKPVSFKVAYCSLNCEYHLRVNIGEPLEVEPIAN